MLSIKVKIIELKGCLHANFATLIFSETFTTVIKMMN